PRRTATARCSRVKESPGDRGGCRDGAGGGAPSERSLAAVMTEPPWCARCLPSQGSARDSLPLHPRFAFLAIRLVLAGVATGTLSAGAADLPAVADSACVIRSEGGAVTLEGRRVTLPAQVSAASYDPAAHVLVASYSVK